ncbi:MAG: hypothetical protein ACUVSW_13975 [Roseiflexus sp.]
MPTPTETPTPVPPTPTETPIPPTNVQVTKSVSNDPVQVGQPITWTITVTNNGTTSVTVTRIFDTFEPADSSPVAFSIGTCTSPQGGTCVISPLYTQATWTGSVALGPGESMQLLIGGAFLSLPLPGSDARCNVRWEVETNNIGSISSGSPALCVEVQQ